MGKVYAVAMHKGGAGKTSLITNLAGAIVTNHPDKKVLIIDTDGQGNSLMAFGGVPEAYETGIHNLFTKTRSVRECIYPLYQGIDIIPATDDMNFIEFDILLNDELKKKPFELLMEAVDEVRDEYDYIFLDTPPSLSIVTGNALRVCDKVLIPFHPETYGVAGVMKIVQTIEDLAETFDNGMEILGIVAMKVRSHTVEHNSTVKEAKMYFKEETNIKFFDTAIPDSIRFPTYTKKNGLPATLVEDKKFKDLIKKYYELLEEIELEEGVVQ